MSLPGDGEGDSFRRVVSVLFPNVAVYIDDQSAQLPNRNLDIYGRRFCSALRYWRPAGHVCSEAAPGGVVR